MPDLPDTSTELWPTWQLHDHYDRVEREVLASLRCPRTPEQWAHHKPSLRAAIADAVGFRPALLPSVEAQRLGTTQREGYTVERIVFHGWPKAPISANLYLPDGLSAPAPAIAAPHGHSMDGKAHAVYQHCHINLARRGYVVLAWDMIGYGERQAMGHKDERWPMLAGLSLKGLLITEAQALVTWLTQQPQVDAERIGCTGNSGGGAQTLLLAALDTRIAAAAPAGHVSPLAFIADKEKNLCTCTLLPNILRFAEIEHVLGLIAPRPAMIVAGRDDCLFPDDLVRRSHRMGRRMYAIEGVEVRLELFVGACAHGYEKPKREAMYAFFDRTLKGQDVEHVEEPPTEPEPPESPALRCWHNAGPDFATVRELAQQLAAQISRPSMDRVQLWADVLGIREIPKVTKTSSHTGPEGWEATLLSMSHGVVLPASVSRPDRPTKAATIVVDDQGRNSDRAMQCANAARARRDAVLMVDLLGWGSTRPSELLARGDDETFAAQRGVFFGRPLLGERAAELVAATEWATEALQADSVTWEAFGWAALAALVACAAKPKDVAPALCSVRLHAMPIRSFWDECDGPRPLFTFPQAILNLGDIDALAALTREVADLLAT